MNVGSITRGLVVILLGLGAPGFLAPSSLAQRGGLPNDDCADAAAVSVGTTTFTTVGATTDGPMPSNCGAGNFIGADVWYRLVAPATGLAEWTTCGTTGLDTTLQVFDTCAGSPLICVDDSCGSQTTVTWPVSAGSSYTLRLGGFEGQTGSGSFTLSVLPPCPLSPPAGAALEGEACSFGQDFTNGGCNSVPPRYGGIACGGAIRGTAWATENLRDTDWFRFSLSRCTQVRLEGAAQFPFRLILATDNCGNTQVISSVTGNRCEPGAPPPPGGATARLPAGSYIAWVGPSDFTGTPCGSGFNDYWVRLECTPASPIANDLCAAAIPVGAGTHEFDNGSCAANDFFGSCGFAEVAPDVWFRYIPSQTGNAIVSTCSQTALDTVVSVLDECAGNEIICVDDSCGVQTEFVLCGVVVGEDYLIRIAGFDGATGSGTFTITEVTTPPNDACQGASLLGVPGSAVGSTVGACAEPVACPCGPGDTSASLWYRFVGSGSVVTVSLCGSAAPFDTAVSIYTGDCGQLECAATDDDGCGGGVAIPSRIDVCTAAGQSYLVRVSGFGDARGEFQLDLLDTGPPCDDPIGPCTIVCDADSVPEGESCGDDMNGGCNSSPPTYHEITDSCPIRATTWAFGSLRDTDWYRVVLPSGGDISARVRGQTDLAIFLIQDVCPPSEGDFLSLGEFRPCAGGSPCGVVSASGLPPGAYSIFVAPGTLAGPVFDGAPCGFGLEDYCLQVQATAIGSCEACCDMNSDNVVNSQDFFDFLACFFAPACPGADFNGDGGANSQDFFDFLACFFSPPAGCP